MVLMQPYRESIERFIRDPRTIFDWFYWLVRRVRVMALRDAFRDADGTLKALATLTEMRGVKKLKDTPLSDFIGGSATESDTKELGELFTKNGSDKATKHDYYALYAFLLRGKRNNSLNIFEIGLGTNNTDVPSNMGRDGKPGASLRGFRDWAPKANVYGADVDKRVLFSEERIQTFFIDQTDTASLTDFAQKYSSREFDLIIDDGLHNPWANINTLNAVLPLLKTGAFFVIEDIVEKYLPTWNIVATLLPKEYSYEFIKCRTEWVFLVKRK